MQLEDAFNHLSQTVHTFDDQVIQNGSQWPQPRLFRAVEMLCDDIASQFKCAGIHLQRSSKSHKKQQPQVMETRAQTQAAPSPLIRTRTDYPSQFWNLFMGSSSVMIPSSTTQSVVVEPGIIPFSPTPTFETNTIQYATSPFTQQLFRACAESGLRLLSNTSFTDEDIRRCFGLLLQKMAREDIRDYFTRVVSIQPCNPIIDDRFPFISLGGAGTHFSSPSNDASQVLSLMQRTNGVCHIASDEQWFDVHDVERYLSNQGIIVGEFPSPTSPVHHLHSENGVTSNLVAIQGASPSTTMTMVISEYRLIHKLSQIPVDLGCVAGFRRSDVERVVYQNLRRIAIGDPG
ncbi:unnamed protein product [Penicillium salamii]|nr:unnamed protein product [Penicillium salamii]CAG8422000.1 unnamed protein product [Penicillium salamii]